MADSWINICFLTAEEYVKQIRKMYKQHKISYKELVAKSALAKRCKIIKVYKSQFGLA